MRLGEVELRGAGVREQERETKEGLWLDDWRGVNVASRVGACRTRGWGCGRRRGCASGCSVGRELCLGYFLSPSCAAQLLQSSISPSLFNYTSTDRT